ncbi:MAG: hypothetical protein R3300_16725 [Candidatus Promineifilaceae bacterium]|nr:hypothetical protein [Candidatus Promineifilaceae bacterium]
MLENLTLLAGLIIGLWIVAVGYYFYVSRKQKELSEEIDELREMLDDKSQE